MRVVRAEEDVTAIVGIPFGSNHLRSMLLDERAHTGQVDEQPGRRLLTIRAADSEGHRGSAHILVNRMYAGRGYSTTPVDERRRPGRITLIGTDRDITRGTITIGFDGSDHLLADGCFPDVLEQLRREATVLCEFIKLAIDGVGSSRRVLASLFHTAFIYAHQIKGCDRILIEVNPRHVRFYEVTLGFTSLTGERLNRRVNAPAVLMSLELAFAEQQILRVQSGNAWKERSGRSLYCYCFSREEAAGIAARLRAIDHT